MKEYNFKKRNIGVRILFYNPERKKFQVETDRDFRDIRIYTCARTNFDLDDFFIVTYQCDSTKEIEQNMKAEAEKLTLKNPY